MATGFPGFPPEGIEFLRSLVRHNRREWFQPRKAIFEEQVRQPMRELVEALNRALSGFAPDYVSDPDKAIYRIYRDTRFSSDKTPYKNHVAASFRRRATAAHADAGFYFAISHKEVAIGGGLYMPEPKTLLALRHHIAAHHEELRRILAQPALRRLLGGLHGEQLSRAPKGFPADHPADDLLRYKGLFLYVELPPELATARTLYGEIVKRFRVIGPFLNFLTVPLGRARPRIDARDLL